MLKKLWKFITYIFLIVSIIATIKSIFVGDIRLIIDGLVCVVFSASLALKNTLANKNKVIEIAFWVSCSILIISNLLGVFFGVKVFY